MIEEREHLEIIEVEALDLLPGDRIRLIDGDKVRAITGIRKNPDITRVAIHGIGHAQNFESNELLLIWRWFPDE